MRALLCLLLLACSTSLAQIEIRDVRAARVSATDPRVVVDIDVRATEGAGRHLGTYCVEVNFPGDTDIQRVCQDDLVDGDVRTVRIFSQGNTAPGATLTVIARTANWLQSETTLAP